MKPPDGATAAEGHLFPEFVSQAALPLGLAAVL